MATTKYEIQGLDCLCCKSAASRRIAYILYPMDILDDWIEAAAQKFGTSIVVITGMDWDNDLTPWPAPGVPAGCPPFQGHGDRFLKRLEALVSAVETDLQLGASASDRALVGVSLSGLFTLWAWPQTDLFGSIASLSGSFWYQGFIEWFARQDFSGKTGQAYFLLGRQEAASKVKAFDSVQVNTEAIVKALRADGLRTHLQLVPGNHYSDPIPRLNLAMAALASLGIRL